MKVDNLMLFFRGENDEASVTSNEHQTCFPAKSLVGMSPASDTTLTMTFKNVRNNHLSHNEQIPHVQVVLTVQEGDAFEVMEGIMRAINSNPHHDGFLVIADDCTIKDGATGSTPAADTVISTQYVHPSIEGIVSIGGGSFKFIERFPDFGVGNAEPTDISATALTVNTHYQSIAAATAMTIPAAADGKTGDWITVFYDVAAGNTNAHTYTTTTDTTFALGSTIRTNRGSHADRIPTTDIAEAGNDIITITGATNGDGGKGTYLKFVNLTGAAQGWAAEVYVTDQGSGVTAATAAFS